jgi:hypothetical protein
MFHLLFGESIIDHVCKRLLVSKSVFTETESGGIFSNSNLISIDNFTIGDEISSQVKNRKNMFKNHVISLNFVHRTH